MSKKISIVGVGSVTDSHAAREQELKSKYAGLAVRNISYQNEAHYEGQVNELSRKHGRGILRYPNGAAVYEGFFDDNKMEYGKIEYYQNGVAYCSFLGDFDEDSQQWKKGLLQRGNATYEGHFENQQMNGQFTVIWGQRDQVYVGQVVDNHLEGIGTMTFKNGAIDTILGVWSNDKLQECTLLTMKDGSTASNYSYDYASGQGILIGKGEVRVGHSTYSGTWNEQGKLNGPGTIVNANDQGQFHGNFVDNVREGLGKYIWPNNQGEYEGPFKNGMRQTEEEGDLGLGKMTWTNGETKHFYEGQWSKGQCTQGTLDGQVVDVDAISP